MPVTPGTTLGPYEILSPLGAGGMGEVYRARDTRLGREVALKVLPSSFSADTQGLRRFEQEARLASSLNHPNIITIYEIDGASVPPFIASELVGGETLRRRFSHTPLTLREALDIAIQVVSALAPRTRAGVVHRDSSRRTSWCARTASSRSWYFGSPSWARVRTGRMACGGTPRPRRAAGQNVAGVVMGHRPLHVAGAGAGPGDRRPQRHLSFGAVSTRCSRPPAFDGATRSDIPSAAVLMSEPPPFRTLTPSPRRAGSDSGKALRKIARSDTRRARNCSSICVCSNRRMEFRGPRGAVEPARRAPPRRGGGGACRRRRPRRRASPARPRPHGHR